MIAILALGVLVLSVSSAQAVLARADPEPQADRSHVAPASCPYQFGSDMPAASFCVYRGAALGVRPTSLSFGAASARQRE